MEKGAGMIDKELKKKIGQLFMAGFPSPKVDEQALRLMDEYEVGNFILFARNVVTSRQLLELCEDLSDRVFTRSCAAPFISMDHEGGLVSRVMEGAALMPGAAALSAACPDLNEETRSMVHGLGVLQGKILRSLGVNTTNAPVLDVNMDPKNPIIGARSYSDDPARVSFLGVSMLTGLESGGVMAAMKHFPGHGNVSSDSHLGIPENNVEEAVFLETELRPFADCIAHGAKALMTSHVRYKGLDEENPGTLSPYIYQTLLRGRCQYEGLVLTDCLEMDAIAKTYPSGEGAVRALEAGADILTISHTFSAVAEAAEAVYAAVESGRLSRERIEASYDRIMAHKKERGLLARQRLSHEKAEALLYDSQAMKRMEEAGERSVTCLTGDFRVSVDDTRSYVLLCSDHFASNGAEDMRPRSFCREMEESLGSRTVAFPLSLEKESVPEVLRKLEEALRDIRPVHGKKQVLLGVYNALFREGAKALMKELLPREDLELTVLLMGTPYDIPLLMKECLEGPRGEGGFQDALYESIRAVICTYEYTPLSMRCLLKAMQEKQFKGKNPFSRLY